MLKMLNAHNAMRTVLENRRITLELALRQLAQTVGGQAPDQEEIAAFFHDFMDGYWDAFEEATSHDSDDLREIDRQIQLLGHTAVCKAFILAEHILMFRPQSPRDFFLQL